MFRFNTWAKGLLFGALSVGLVACGEGEDPAAPTEIEVSDAGTVVERSRRDQAAARQREKRRQAAAEAVEEDFAYFRYRVDTSGAEPEACFVFSAGLAPEADYSPFVDLRPAEPPVLAVNGRELCLSGIGFGERRTAILRSGLPAADGRQLAATEEVPIDFADRPPYVGFRGGGVILPRSEADGLPIETVNVDRVNLTVSHVPDRALYQKEIGQGQTAAEGRYPYLYGEADPRNVAQEIWSGSMAVARVDNAPVTTVFPLQDVIGDLEPGAYFVEVTDAKEVSPAVGPPASARRWIVMTDLALTAYRGEHGLDATLRSLQDGQEIIGARVELIAENNDVLAEGDTDADGRVRFDKPIMSGTGNGAAKLLIAPGARGDIAVLDLSRAPVDVSELNVGGRSVPGSVDAYVYTERGIYRPGETVHISALVRDREGRAITERAGTLTIVRPNGLEAESLRFGDTDSGAVLHDFALAPDASRGQWLARIDVDGAGRVGSTRFSVEDFVPQRIGVDLNGNDQTALFADESRAIEVDARFLYGAPGAGLVVQPQARLEVAPTPFDLFPDFDFGAHDETFRERILEIPETVTDGEGMAAIVLEPGNRGRESGKPLRINTVVSVLEPGGRAVTESMRVPYLPRELYLGTKAAFEGRLAEGEASSIEIVAVGQDGDARAETLSWKLLAIDYHYDWYREDGQWRWRRSRTVTTVNEGPLTTPDGGTQEIPLEGLDWGQHELLVEGTDGAMASRSFWVGWGGYASDDGVEAPDRVQVSIVDETVRPGRNAEITIVPPYDGEAQIVIATDRILAVETRPVTAEGTRLTLPVTDDWGEGAYVMVNVFTEREPVMAAKPRRAVGIAYAPVDMNPRTFNLTLNAPDVIRPRREQLIEVEIDGGPREGVFLTLAAVDEGILNLTKYQSPDPVAYFFGKKALGVTLHDDYGRLLDPNLGLPAEVRTGGDQLGGEGLSVVPVKTVSLFSGEVDVGRAGSAKVRFEVPDFNGELRLMAVAWSEEGLGAASRSVTVRDQAPAELILPRFLAPGDEATLTASIDNVELTGGEFSASLAAAGPVEIGVDAVSRTLPEGARADVPVSITTANEGISRLRLSVQGPENFAVDREYLIETRSPFLPQTRVITETMSPGETYTLSRDLIDGLEAGSIGMTVSFSSLPVDANALYASLSQYPYGCTEQTVSRALPLLYSDQLVAFGADTGDNQTRTQVQDAVSRILNRQGADGAFGLWREGDGHARPWLGAYTTDFLHRAKAAGYAVPDAALDRAYTAMRTVATGDAWRVYGYDSEVYENRWHNDTQARMMNRASAYALYVLAKSGEADLSRLRYLHDRALDDLDSPLAQAHLGAGLAAMGDRSRAASAFAAAEDSLGYENNGDYYQTPLRDLAGVLALAVEAGFDEVSGAIADRLGADAPDPVALSTQEKAFLLTAVNALSGGETGQGGYEMAVEGLGRGNNNDRRYFIAEGQVSEDVSFAYDGSAPVFRTVLISGAPVDAPPAASNRLGISKAFATLTGDRVRLGDVRQGDQLVVSITLDPEERRLNPLIVADLLPAGFEIETILRPADGVREYEDDGAFAWVGEIAAAKTAEARDDRFVAAVDVRDTEMTLAYVVRAVTPGDFAIPGAVAEDMYRPDVFARSAAGRVVIARRDEQPGGGR
ncbi:MAG: alpha-2-macroglobulin [Pseudomonadota bacterium]